MQSSTLNDDQIEELRKIRNRALNKEKGTIRIDGKCNNNGELVQSFDKPFVFSEDATHTVSLTMLVISALFPNLDETSNKFYYNNGTQDKEFTVDAGCYDVEEYGEIVKAKIKQLGDNAEKITIKLNKGSGKVMIDIESNYKVYFRENTWYKCLGFDLNTTLMSGLSISSKIADVVPSQVINVECDLVDSRFNKYNDKPSRVIFSFPANSKFGALLCFRMDANETAKILGKKHFDSVCLKFYDTNNKPITAMHYEINIELQIIQT